MKALDLLVDLRARGAQVSAIDGQIAIHDRCGTVTAEDRAALAELKAEILELLATAGEIAPSVPEMPAPDPFTPWYPWRAIVATWPVAWRRRWGRRANELEDSGQDWREVERIAFLEVSFSPGAPGGTPPLEASPAWSDRAARAGASGGSGGPSPFGRRRRGGPSHLGRPRRHPGRRRTGVRSRAPPGPCGGAVRADRAFLRKAALRPGSPFLRAAADNAEERQAIRDEDVC